MPGEHRKVGEVSSRQRKCESQGAQQKDNGLFREQKEGHHGQCLLNTGRRSRRPNGEENASGSLVSHGGNPLNSRGLVPRGKNEEMNMRRSQE